MDFIFKVDPIRRSIKVPDAFTVLTMDHNIHKLVFICPYYEDFAFDSASIVFMVDAPDGKQYIIPAEEYESFPNSPSPYVKFTLTLKSYITSVVGYMSFCITADIISSGNVIEKSWHSKNITISVGGHIDNDDSEDIPEEDVPTINQRLNNLDSKVGRLQTTVNGMANGTPPTASSTSEMDPDKSTVYINTTDGNWYYYDGSAWQIGGTYGGAVTDTTLSISGAPADAKAVGDALAEKADADDVDALDGRVTALESGSSSGLTTDIKAALLACFRNVAWINEDGQDFYDALDAALNPPANLLSITAVYTQSGTVYDTASLDDLKPDLVVTAHWSDNTTSIVTTYTLSGTLTEGTSTITVSYGGKSTTFNVTVSVFSTAPVILATDTQWKKDYTQGSKTGLCITDWYSCDVDYDALKATAHYDSTNDYMTQMGDIYKIVTHFPNSQSIAFSGDGKSVVFFDMSGEEKHASATTLANEDGQFASGRQNSNYMHADNGHFKFSFTLGSADVDDSYAYWDSTMSGVMPIGVTVGDIIFAGRNTPYWGCSNISEASS